MIVLLFPILRLHGIVTQARCEVVRTGSIISQSLPCALEMHDVKDPYRLEWD